MFSGIRGINLILDHHFKNDRYRKPWLDSLETQMQESMLFILCYIESDQRDSLQVSLEKSKVTYQFVTKVFLVNVELKFIANFYFL